MKRCIVIAVAGLAAGACQASLDTTRTPDSYASFGDVIYREACQRVAYTGQLDQQQAGAIERVDVSGALGRSVCVANEPPPQGSPEMLLGIVAEHPALVANVNTILPQPFLASLETFLERILPLYDDGTMQSSIAGIGQLFGQLHDDPAVATGLARIGARHGYRPAGLNLLHELVEYPVIDDFLGSFLGIIGPGGAAESDWRALLAGGAVALGTAEQVADPADPQRSLKLALDLLFARHADLASGTPRPAVARDARGLALVTVDAGGVIAPFVDLDHDGLADIDASGRFIDAQGGVLDVPTPFPELGVPDRAPRDALGRALIGAGASTTLYQYLDLDGTLLIGAAREAPVLLDASKDTALGLVWGAAGLLGPRAMQTRTYRNAAGAEVGTIAYNGFDLGQSPALDLLHSFVQVLGAPDIDQVLQAASLLLTVHESDTARVIGDMLDTSDLAKQHPEAQIPGNSTIYDELAPLLARTLRVPGLAQDLVAALQDPHVRGFAPMIARLMTLTNQLDFNHTNAPVNGVAGAPAFDLLSNLDTPELVDRSKPDTDYNRSVMQRISHLIHDANGAEFCNKPAATTVSIGVNATYARCKLFKIEDVSLLFALSMATPQIIQDTRLDPVRRATTYDKASFREQITDPTIKAIVSDDDFGDTNLTKFLKIDGFTRFPTPKALARALFLRSDDTGTSQFLRDSTEPVLCHDGDRFIDVHDKSIFAWEVALPGNPSGFPDDTFYDAVRPLIDAFAKHDECLDAACTEKQNAVKIFIDLLSMLHEHWGSPQSSYFGHHYQATDRAQPRYAAPDNVVSYEPVLAQVLDGDLTSALLDFAPVLQSLTLDGAPTGPPALPVLIEALRYVFDPQIAPEGLSYRDGRIAAVMSDGHTPAGRVTPYVLIGDAFAGKRAMLAALSATPDGAMQADKWKAGAQVLVDEILTVDHPDATSWKFHNRRLHAMTSILVDFLRGRVQAHAAAGDLASWVHTGLTADLTDKLAGPVFAALGDLAGHLEHDPVAHAQLYSLLSYVMDEQGHDQVFRTGLTLLADQAQLFLDDRDLVPIVRVLGAAMDPDKGSVNAQIALLKRAHELDTDKVVLTILRRLFQPDAAGVQPASDLVDIVSAINRTAPGQGGDLDAGDEARVLGALRDFFIDSQRGFLRFVGIVHNRKPAQDAP